MHKRVLADEAMVVPFAPSRRDTSPVQPGAAVLQARNLCYATDRATLIPDLSLDLGTVPRTVLLGPNGAGKSLTLRLLQGVLAPRSGFISWPGQEQGQTRPRTALVFQRPVLLRRTVRANLAHALKVYGLPKEQQAERINALLAQADLSALADRPARLLSGGEQQRLSLVRALGMSPDLLFLDEPTASLDPRSTARLEGLIAGAVEAGTKIVLVTHDIGQARRLGDRVIFLADGQVTEETPADRFFEAPQSRQASAYLRGDLVF